MPFLSLTRHWGRSGGQGKLWRPSFSVMLHCRIWNVFKREYKTWDHRGSTLTCRNDFAAEMILYSDRQIDFVMVPNSTKEFFVLQQDSWCWQWNCCGRETLPNFSGSAAGKDKGLTHQIYYTLLLLWVLQNWQSAKTNWQAPNWNFRLLPWWLIESSSVLRNKRFKGEQ